jgi:hypothetical protein
MSIESHDGVICSGENRRIQLRTCSIATVFTTNPTLTNPGANPGLRGENMATNRLIHGTSYLRLVFYLVQCVQYYTFKKYYLVEA